MSEQNEGLWYVSQPSRLGGMGKEGYREKVLQFFLDEGHHVIHPFNAYPYHHFEGNSNVGREQSMQYCCDLVDFCEGRVFVTGVSEGVLMEVDYALNNWGSDNIKLFIRKFDQNWQNQVAKFSNQAKLSKALRFINSQI